jgi:hypothetical protein
MVLRGALAEQYIAPRWTPKMRVGRRMLRKSLIAVVTLVTTFVVPQYAVGDTDWWGRKLPNVATQFIFGYGSLAFLSPRRSTGVAADASGAATPPRAAFAFAR